MKISRLHVRGFGKIEDFDTTLSKGLNVIYGPNESGKSTLMEFIKAMLYGLRGGRATNNGIKATAKKYQPWTASLYGGFINFELDNGHTYRIDRDFEKGTVKLFDESFNEITSSYTDNKDRSDIAERLIGLNESLFERTVYVKQLGTRIDNSSSKDLIDRISNIRQSGTEDISYKNANVALKEALKQQVGTDRSYTRPLDIINKRLGELNETKIRIKDEYKSFLEARIKQEELLSQISKLTAKERLFARLQEFCELKERHKLQQDKNDERSFLNERIIQSKKEISILNKEKAELQHNIDNNSEHMILLSKEQDCNEQECLAALNKKTAQETSQGDVTKRITGVMQDNIQKQRAWSKVLNICIIVSLIAVIGAIGGTFVFSALETWITVLPILATITLAILRLKSNGSQRKLEVQQSGFHEKSEKLKNELNNALKIDKILQQQIASVNERITGEKTQYEQLDKRLENLNIKYKQVDITTLENEMNRVYKIISELRKAIDMDLNHTEKELYENILVNNSDSYTKITELRDFLSAQLQQKKLENATVEAYINKNENIQKDELIEDEIARLSQQKERLEQRGEALSIAIKTLEEATNDVQKKYIPVMNKVLKSTFSELTAEKYSDIRAGENLTIMLNDPMTEMVVPVSMLSSGTIDQMYLALRIAISETVLKINEGLPFIMDEPFAQYDDQRTDNALSCIYNISKKQQVIIFTCKQREVDLISSQYTCKICSLT